jgi:hypothetical protein
LEFGGDGEEAFVQALQLSAGFLIAQLPAVDLQEMPGSGEYLADTGEIGSDGGGTGGQRKFGNEVMLCILAGGAKLAMQVLLRDLDIA